MKSTILLHDGRTLAYAEYGDPKGTPVFFFHGTPGSRLFHPSEEVTKRLGVRLICMDRPGYGDSTYQPNRRLLDCNAKVLAALLGENESSAGYLDEILGRIPQAPFAVHQLQNIIAAFGEFLPAMDTRELLHFPRLITDLQHFKPGSEAADAAFTLRCLPACALALVPNSPDTRGVLTELARLADSRSWSEPLRALTGIATRVSAKPKRRPRMHVPASLSSAQSKALHASASYPTTLVIGPPGTGKSFTGASPPRPCGRAPCSPR